MTKVVRGGEGGDVATYSINRVIMSSFWGSQSRDANQVAWVEGVAQRSVRECVVAQGRVLKRSDVDCLALFGWDKSQVDLESFIFAEVRHSVSTIITGCIAQLFMDLSRGQTDVVLE